jgi:hypothetical protein
MTHLAAAVIVAVPFAIWVAGIVDIMTTSQDTRMALSRAMNHHCLIPDCTLKITVPKNRC